MQLNKIASLFLAAVLLCNTAGAIAATQPKETAKKTTTQKKTTASKAVTTKKTTATKKATTTKNTTTTKKTATAKKTTSSKKTATTKKTTTTKKVAPQNETKAKYGVAGAKLTPTDVRTSQTSYQVKGTTHTVMGKEASLQYSKTGTASYYAKKFHGKKTASGETYNENAFTAAHKTLAIGSYALVTNLTNGKKVIVRINDRGPFSQSRIIDLSKVAAKELGMIQSGTAQVKVEAMQVDSQGNISGKGAESLLQIAKKEGLSLKIKPASPSTEANTESETQADTESQIAMETETKPQAQAAQPAEPHFSLKVLTKTEKEAQKIVKSLKQTTRIEPTNNRYAVIIDVADQTESRQVKQRIAKLGNYQIFSYSEQ